MISEKQVLPIIASALGVDKNKVNINSSMADFPEWDSLGHLTILSALDDAFGDKYQESEELASAETVMDIIEALNK